MPIRITPGLQDLTTQLENLKEKVRAGLAPDAVADELQAALDVARTIATHDDLTGALNRRGVVQKLDAELDRAQRTGHPFSMAVIAVDRFHDINAQHGARVGDDILRSLAQSALGLFRSLDVLGRIGGHEFALILPATWLDQSDKAIARLTGAVSTADWSGILPALTVTFSAGLTTNAPGDTAEGMIRRAGEALAQAQAQGPGACVQLEQALPDFDPDML